MKILDVLNAPWAIVPDKLAEITEIYSRHLGGDKIDIKGIEAQLGKPLANHPKGYSVLPGGVALLPVEGVLAKKMNLFMDVSGGTSMQLLARDLRQALGDPVVGSVILMIDSPGGTVDGTQEVSRAVLDARAGDKPVVAWVDGLMASAAYWIGSAADAVFVGADTDQVGSIGVAAQHVDYSRRQEMMGVKVTDIYAGKYKRIASQNAPLSEEGRSTLQDHVDYLYSLFVETVAQHRGVSAEQVVSDMADGRIFVGRQAMQAGLVDGASTLDALVAELASGTYVRRRSKAAGVAAVAPAMVASPQADASGAGAAPSVEPTHNEDTMDLKTLKEKHPEVAQALIDEGFAAGKAEGRTEGATAERERILAVEAQAMPGHEALVAALKADGKTTAPEAAVQVLAAERAKGAARLQALRKDGPDPAPAAASPSGDAGEAAAAAEAGLPVEERAKARFERDPAIRAEFQTLERYTGWMKHEGKRLAA